MTEHLRPCPLCGWEPVQSREEDGMVEVRHAIMCPGCGIELVDYRGADACAANWNERALGPALDVVLEAVQEDGLCLPETLQDLRALRDEARTEAGEEKP